MPGTIAAVVDIGSNSARLQIAEVNGEEIRELGRDRVMLRLAAAIDDDGRITPDGIGRTAAAVARFAAAAQAHGIVPVVVATSAIRDARNRDEVVRAIEAAAPIRLRLLSGDEEARLAARGALLRLPPVAHGMVLDLGGGSLEIALIEGGRWREGWSWPLGALRTAIRLVHQDPAGPDDIARVRGEVLAALGDARVPPLAPGHALVGTGGNARALAKLASESTSRAEVHGVVVERPLAHGWARRLATASQKRRAKLKQLDPERADSIHVGVLIIDVVMEYLRATALTVSDGGLREGVLLEGGGKVIGSQ